MMKSNRPAATLQQLGELILAHPTQAGCPPFIAAASGLVRHGDYFFVVADDELQLGIFSARTLQPGAIPLGKTWPLLPGQLPLEAAARKRAKPDFEALVLLPPAPLHPHGALLIFGSGSSTQRNRGVLVALNAQGLPDHTAPLILDFAPLYALLAREFGVVNIEGAVVQHEQLLLLQRGNSKNGVNAIVQLELAALLREIITSTSAHAAIGSAALRNIQHYTLGSIDGVALGFTDATCLPDGQLLALAVAEDSDDAYADGATLGSCLCRFASDNQLLAITPLAAPAKTEGLTVWQCGPGIDTVLAFVTDADDAQTPARLLTAPLAAFY
jgi:hypothetical protein